MRHLVGLCITSWRLSSPCRESRSWSLTRRTGSLSWAPRIDLSFNSSFFWDHCEDLQSSCRRSLTPVPRVGNAFCSLQRYQRSWCLSRVRESRSHTKNILSSNSVRKIIVIETQQVFFKGETHINQHQDPAFVRLDVETSLSESLDLWQLDMHTLGSLAI